MKSVPVVVIQPLPQHLWERTSLNAAKLGLAQTRSTRVPLLGSLSPDSFRSVAELLAHRVPSRSEILRFVNRPEDFQTIEPESIPGLTPQVPDTNQQRKLFKAFKHTSDALTFRLALYCASLPMTLPILRLAQAAFAPEATAWQLSDLFLWRLIRRKGMKAPGTREPATLAELDKIEYEFWPVVGQLLRADAGIDRFLQAAATGHTIYVHSRTGRGNEFIAYILGGDDGDHNVDGWSDETRAFANISRSRLREFGIRPRGRVHDDKSWQTDSSREIRERPTIAMQDSVSVYDSSTIELVSSGQRESLVRDDEKKIAASKLIHRAPDQFTGRSQLLDDLNSAWASGRAAIPSSC